MSPGRLASRYSLLRPLGSGGMGRVWLARDEMLDREVAVKELTLPEGLAPRQRSALLTRAVREARATARLRHPGIVALHDVIVEHERPWLVMELLRGRTLAEIVSLYGPMPPEQVARIGADVLEALSAAHAVGLQHRDVKPGNVFLTDGGRVVLTDFGIARQEGQATLTEQGLMTGSPGFIAPERLEGDPGGPAGDLWSLGATLFTVAEGRPCFEGTAGERIRATLTEPPPVARKPLGPVLAAMMARHPASRPPAPAVVHALREIAAGRPGRLPAAHDVTAPGRTRGRGRPALWIALAAVLVLLAGGGAALFLVRGGGRALPAAFTVPMDVCSLLSPQEVGGLLNTRQPPEPRPGSDELGPSCDWPIQGSGVSVQLQKDSDTPDPWTMTPTTAHILFGNQQRYWAKYDSMDWTYPEIGVRQTLKATRTPVHPVAGVGEEAFGYDLKGSTGRVHSAHVFYRLANLVVFVEYTTLAGRPADKDIEQAALTAARASERALRRAG